MIWLITAASLNAGNCIIRLDEGIFLMFVETLCIIKDNILIKGLPIADEFTENLPYYFLSEIIKEQKLTIDTKKLFLKINCSH